uniref:Uncharacterized protein n=1 Tax=Sphaerodactylus townsendi TaxID=933632 RepID=A0ACB8FWV4_9SAUR
MIRPQSVMHSVIQGVCKIDLYINEAVAQIFTHAQFPLNIFKRGREKNTRCNGNVPREKKVVPHRMLEIKEDLVFLRVNVVPFLTKNSTKKPWSLWCCPETDWLPSDRRPTKPT